jgi:hypothetical protein
MCIQKKKPIKPSKIKINKKKTKAIRREPADHHLVPLPPFREELLQNKLKKTKKKENQPPGSSTETNLVGSAQ